jgi:hypothetical protein
VSNKPEIARTLGFISCRSQLHLRVVVKPRVSEREPSKFCVWRSLSATGRRHKLVAKG